MRVAQGVASATGRMGQHRRTMACSCWVLVMALQVAACGTGQKGGNDEMPATAAAKQTSILDSSLGLDKNDVFATPDPIVAPMQGSDPGENHRVAAYFKGAPPPIPHLIDDLLPIRADENQCLDCHDDPGSLGSPVAEGDPTPIPASHYTDLRRAPGKVTDALIGARYVCVQCHAPQHDAVPLVANTYEQ